MKTKRSAKLSLSKETVKAIAGGEIGLVAGGTVRNSCVGCIESYFRCSGGCTVTCATQCGETCDRYHCQIWV